mgnify:CR=1 FL=1
MIYKNQNILNAALFNVEDFDELPSCGVEDVDRSLFNLFSEVLPFYYEENGEQKKYPAIFASGERASILKRRRPLRDQAGALILPLISIMRTGLVQDPDDYGVVPTGDEIVIKKRIYTSNLALKEEINENNLQNQTNTKKETTADGAFAKRVWSIGESNISFKPSTKNIYETFTIPTPRFFKASYEVVFWTTNQMQMNSVFETLLSLYTTATRTFRLETEKGYNFTAHVESGFNTEDNVDSLNDSERILKSTIIIEVGGYVVNSRSPGLPPTIKRYVSSPKLTFETVLGAAPKIKKHSQESSNDANNYIETAWDNEFDALPGSALGLETKTPTTDVTIGTTNKMVSKRYYLEQLNPKTGKTERVEYVIKDSNHRKGETVLRQVKVL